MKNKFIICSLFIFSIIINIKVYASMNLEDIDIADIKILTSESKTVNDSILKDFGIDIYNYNGKTVLIDNINFDNILSLKTSSNLLNYMYPSGIRLPTMLLVPEDFCIDNEGLSFYTSYGSQLLWIICQNNNIDRVNFTTYEINAADKYYKLMQLKSMSLNLPLYSFNKVDTSILEYTTSQHELAKEIVKNFESKFGQILFIDTSKLEYNWCKIVREQYTKNIDMLITKNSVLPFIVPLNNEIKNLYQAYRTFVKPLQSTNFSLNFSEITNNYRKYSYKNFINNKVVYSTCDDILLLGQFYEQIPLNQNDYFVVGKANYREISKVNKSILDEISNNDKIEQNSNIKQTVNPPPKHDNKYNESFETKTIRSDLELIKLDEKNSINNNLFHNIFSIFCGIFALIIISVFVLIGIINKIRNQF